MIIGLTWPEEDFCLDRWMLNRSNHSLLEESMEDVNGKASNERFENIRDYRI